MLKSQFLEFHWRTNEARCQNVGLLQQKQGIIECLVENVAWQRLRFFLYLMAEVLESSRWTPQSSLFYSPSFWSCRNSTELQLLYGSMGMNATLELMSIYSCCTSRDMVCMCVSVRESVRVLIKERLWLVNFHKLVLGGTATVWTFDSKWSQVWNLPSEKHVAVTHTHHTVNICLFMICHWD